MSDDLTAIEFEIPGEKYPVEGYNTDAVPRVGEQVSVSARFDDDGERAEPDQTDSIRWHELDFGYVLRGTVVAVERDYHHTPSRNECTVNVELEDVEWNDGKRLAADGDGDADD